MDMNRNTNLLTHQQKILTKIALGDSLNQILEDICLAIEQLMDDKTAMCSILRLSGKQLFSIAGPSIDSQYSKAINGVTIGSQVGSCGTAAYLKSRILVDDISSSPLWENFVELASKFDLNACWSTPIISTKSEVLGTFAIYHPHRKLASKEDLKLIDYFVHLSSIALEKNNYTAHISNLINDLEKSNEKLNAIAKVMPDPAVVIDKDGFYIDIYGSTEDFLRTPVEQLLNKNVTEILPTNDSNLIMGFIEKTLKSDQLQIFEYELEVEKGRLIFEGRTVPIIYGQNSASPQRHVLWMIRDITSRKKSERKVNTLAYFDHLTNLPNRRLLTQRLTACVERINESQRIGALFFLDIDNFKRINDSLGHKAGDVLLVELAQRLTSVIRSSDTLARIGGDEFVILLEHVGFDEQDAKKQTINIAQKLQKVFDKKFEIGELAFQVSGSIGICLIEDKYQSAENILQFSDTAMYRAKAKGGNNFSFFDSKFQTLLEKQTKLENDIIRAIDCQEFCAYFQPQVNVVGKLTGGEALIRWKHPQKGLIPPYEFISIAEQFGLIQKLQNIVLQDICKLLNKLHNEDCIDDTFCIAINMSQVQFNSTTLKTELRSIVDDFNVSPTRIKLEITETMLSNDIHYTIKQMKDLKQEGFTFSIDDFGTGYSCLSTLQAYPVDELKIDKSFVDNILNNESGLPIVETIINLAKNLNMTVIAEGVETQEQYKILKDKQVDSIQGYLIAKPMPINEYFKWHKQYIADQLN